MQDLTVFKKIVESLTFQMAMKPKIIYMLETVAKLILLFLALNTTQKE